MAHEIKDSLKGNSSPTRLLDKVLHHGNPLGNMLSSISVSGNFAKHSVFIILFNN